MFEVCRLKRFTGRWVVIGMCESFESAYKMVNAIIYIKPAQENYKFRISPALKTWE